MSYQEDYDAVNRHIAIADLAPGDMFVSPDLAACNLDDELQSVYADSCGRLWRVKNNIGGGMLYTLLMDAPISGATFEAVAGDVGQMQVDLLQRATGVPMSALPGGGFVVKHVGEAPQSGAWKQYVRSGVTEMRPWTDDMVMDGISISPVDRVGGSPKQGDMIARKMSNHADQWLVSAEFFAEAQFKEVSE